MGSAASFPQSGTSVKKNMGNTQTTCCSNEDTVKLTKDDMHAEADGAVLSTIVLDEDSPLDLHVEEQKSDGAMQEQGKPPEVAEDTSTTTPPSQEGGQVGPADQADDAVEDVKAMEDEVHKGTDEATKEESQLDAIDATELTPIVEEMVPLVDVFSGQAPEAHIEKAPEKTEDSPKPEEKPNARKLRKSRLSLCLCGAKSKVLDPVDDPDEDVQQKVETQSDVGQKVETQVKGETQNDVRQNVET